jgi:hypothetical protein
MNTDRNFFIVRDVRRVDARNIRISGDLILKGDPQGVVSWEVSESSSDPTKKPPIQLPPPREKLKWILPGRNSEFYGRIKHYAEAIGYETVEHDDLSYPQ